jgi:hypothetical protein
MKLSGPLRTVAGMAERAIVPVGFVADEVPHQCAVLAESVWPLALAPAWTLEVAPPRVGRLVV